MSVHAQSIKIHLQMLRHGKNNSLDVDGNVTTDRVKAVSPQASLVPFQGLASSGWTQQLARAALHDQPLSSKCFYFNSLLCSSRYFIKEKNPHLKLLLTDKALQDHCGAD